MRETTTSPDQSLRWFPRSLSDHDTHHGRLRDDDTVLARCGALFTPRPTLRIGGPPPGTLATGDFALKATHRTRTRSARSADVAVVASDR